MSQVVPKVTPEGSPNRQKTIQSDVQNGGCEIAPKTYRKWMPNGVIKDKNAVERITQQMITGGSQNGSLNGAPDV